jgi:MSHA biogenesis protein MshJ
VSTATSLLKRFDAISLRERALVAVAVLAAIIGLWDLLFMQPLRNTKNSLTLELSSADPAALAAQEAEAADPRTAALTRAGELQTQIQAVDEQLKTTAAGFIPAQEMVEVIHDMLSRQRALKLVSLRNLPGASLVPPGETTDESGGADADAPAEASALGTAPFVHPIELVIEGEYGDVVTYLKSLEVLPWRFRWKTLDLTTKQYPVNRVRIELSTLSMDKTWLGVGP